MSWQATPFGNIVPGDMFAIQTYSYLITADRTWFVLGVDKSHKSDTEVVIHTLNVKTMQMSTIRHWKTFTIWRME